MALSKPKWQYNIDEFKNSKNYKVHVHSIKLGDVEDPDIFIAQHIWDWQQTDKGKWIMAHSIPSPSYHQYIDHTVYGYVYQICAYLDEKDYTFYRLKYE